MKTVSIFILLIYWSIILFTPIMSEEFKMSRPKLNKVLNFEIKPRNI